MTRIRPVSRASALREYRYGRCELGLSRTQAYWRCVWLFPLLPAWRSFAVRQFPRWAR